MVAASGAPLRSRARAPQGRGLSCRGAGALGARASVMVAPGFSSRRMGLVAPWHVGSAQIRDPPMSPALAGRFFTAERPVKPSPWILEYA